jgi:alpha-tubulin suppressor-like RCC1 family protein
MAPSVAAPPATDILAWGDNSKLQLGNTSRFFSSQPVNVQLPAGTTVTSIGAGSQAYHSLAVAAHGLAFAWGSNAYGQLGDGTTTGRDRAWQVEVPEHMPGVDSPTTITAVSAGTDHSLALTEDGRVLAWGNNDRGQLGDGTTTDRIAPVLVNLSGVVSPHTPIRAIAAGNWYSLAVTSDGEVLAWGAGLALGDGKDADSPLPVKTILPEGAKVTKVAAGHQHSLAVTADGRALAWGIDVEGSLGTGDTNGTVPKWVLLPTGVTVTTVAAGDQHSFAVTTDGEALSWGDNSVGQLGDGQASGRKVPGRVTLPTEVEVTDAAAGGDFGVALTSAGEVFGWGTGSGFDNRSPELTLPAGTASAVAAGANHTLVLPTGS